MCGISGIIVNNNSKELLHHLFKMNEIQKHRGSDDEGYAIFSKESLVECFGERTPNQVKNALPNLIHNQDFSNHIESPFLGLSHNRLSIIDTSYKGHQPMSDDSENYWITYNGEIYNYLEIKTELTRLGYKFSSNTDTEVILYAYIEYGEKCVEKFNGMWSFCIYNRSENTLFCSRDRFGVKPFYYRITENYLAFSSEQKALYHFPNETTSINNKAVFKYLSMGIVEDEATGFTNEVLELKPGHNLTYKIATNELKIYKYYELNKNLTWEKHNLKKESVYIERLENLIENAIKLRLQSDVPVGSCLSGGIDSSIIVCHINQLLSNGNAKSIGSSQQTFTSCFTNELVDEEKWAKFVTDKTNTTWHKTYPNSTDFISDFKDLVYTQDVPFFSSSTYSQYRVMKLAQENNIKVTLDGQGADELFAGYPIYYSSYISNAFKTLDLKALRKNSRELSNNFSNKETLLKQPAKFIASNYLPQRFLNRKFKQKHPEYRYINRSFWNKNANSLEQLKHVFSSSLNQQLSNDFTGEHFKNLLRTGDRNAMRFSIESRMPFADDINLIEYIFSISGSYKIKNGISKHLLREANKTILPKEIYARKDKVGFATPEKKWLKEQSDELLNFIPIENDEFVNWENIRSDWNNLIGLAEKTEPTRLWRLLNLATWRSVHNI